MKKTLFVITILSLTLLSCSTTRNLPEGETLYTGIKKITVVDQKTNAATPIGDEAVTEITAALSCPPNASIAGSSKYRGIPFGLWWYNGFVNSKSRIGKWFFKTFASTPVLLSDVNPTLRTQVASSRLQNYGYFNGKVTEEIIPSKRNPRKAKVSYTVTLGNPMLYDSIEYRNFSPGEDRFISGTLRNSNIVKGEQFSVPNLTAERNRLSALLRDNGYYYYQSNYITYSADTINHPGYISLRVEPQKGLPADTRKPWHIGGTTLRITKPGTSALNYDTLRFRNLTYIYNGEKPPVRPGTILRNIQLRRGALYSQERQSMTLSQLSSLNIFNVVNLSFAPQSGDTLGMNITAQLGKPYDFTLP